MIEPRLYLAGDGTLWVADIGQRDLALLTRVSPGAPEHGEDFSVAAPGGWAATVDSTGQLWCVWSGDGPRRGIVTCCRRSGAAWGPHLQITTEGGDDHPSVIPDTFGNVWIFWYREAAAQIWMCRMGPRSGQETLVAENAGGAPYDIATGKGAFFVTFRHRELGDCIVRGEEHAGFGEPSKL